MCGILGYIGENKRIDQNLFKEALDLLEHRGPDDSGIFSEKNLLFGHRRLSIIDLSSAGKQPMIDSSSGKVITFNGEIYNYIELRNKLESKGHTFRTKTDTEVLLKSYIEWNYDCVKYFNGMWSFCIWDPSERKIFFSRDRFGVKPFYFSFSSKKDFYFSSEPKAINKLVDSKQVNEKALINFILDGKHYDSNISYYKDISVLPSSSCGTYDTETKDLKIWKYWNYPVVKEDRNDIKKDLDEFSDLFDDAVKIRLRSDVPVGLTYSGGIDSTSILTSMGQNGRRFTAFTSIYSKGERGEEKWAKLGVQNYSTITLKSVVSPYENWIDAMKKISWHLDGPTYSPAVYPLWCLMKEARGMKIPVLLEGQGADEELGGYTWYSIINLLNILFNYDQTKNLKNQRIHKILYNIIKTYGLKQSTSWLLRERFPNLKTIYRKRIGLEDLVKDSFIQDNYQTDKINYDKKEKNIVTKRQIFDHSSNILPGLLHYGDAISMAQSIESRHPFLDYRLVEWCFKKPDSTKFNNGISKYILREYLKVNDQIKIANRLDKKGYPTPIASWMIKDNYKLINETILAPSAKINYFFDSRSINNLVKRFKSSNDQIAFHLFKLISVEIWLNECLE